MKSSLRLYLLAALFLSCSLFLSVQAQDAGAQAGGAEGVASESSETIDPAAASSSSESSESSEPPKESSKPFPYARPKPVEGALNLGEGQALALPAWLLYIVFLIILIAVGYIIYLIFESQAEKDRKKLGKLKAKEERKGKKSSSKKKE